MYLTKEEIKQTIEDLAQSQGFYSSLNKNLNEADEKTVDEFLEALENQHFKDAVDLVIYLES